MTGQCFAFMVELAYAILLYVIYNYEGFGIMTYTNVPIIVNFVWATVTVIQIWMSPEIRRFIYQKSNAVQPLENFSKILEVLKLDEQVGPTNEIEMNWNTY